MLKLLSNMYIKGSESLICAGLYKHRLRFVIDTWSSFRSNLRHFRLCSPEYFNKMIEVEKKFTINDTVLENLKSLGAVLVKESNFTDVYYDNSSYALTSKNFWLRQRDGKWELKSPVGSRSVDETLLSSSFKESELEVDILNLIMSPLCKTDDDKSLFAKHMDLIDDSHTKYTTLPEVLRHFECKPFCKFTTTRKTFTFDDFNIDLDITDTGFQVGEIELMADGEENISLMLQKIDAFSQKLGVPTDIPAAGKLGHYLKKINPDHYNTLTRLKVID